MSSTSNSMPSELIADLIPYDLLLNAVEVEKTGHSLYMAIAQKIKDKKLVQIFYTLADEEASHIKIIEQKILPTVGKRPIEKKDIHTATLAFFNYRNFPKDILSEKLKRISDEESVYELAISVELDSILFYQELREFLPVESIPFVDQLIVEERRHFHRLLQLKSIAGV